MCCSVCVAVFFFFKQKTAYEMRISDWSSDVCSSDLLVCPAGNLPALQAAVDAGADAVYAGFRDETNARAFPGLNFDHATLREEIGRASCRERVCQYV